MPYPANNSSCYHHALAGAPCMAHIGLYAVKYRLAPLLCTAISKEFNSFSHVKRKKTRGFSLFHWKNWTFSWKKLTFWEKNLTFVFKKLTSISKKSNIHLKKPTSLTALYARSLASFVHCVRSIYCYGHVPTGPRPALLACAAALRWSSGPAQSSSHATSC